MCIVQSTPVEVFQLAGSELLLPPLSNLGFGQHCYTLTVAVLLCRLSAGGRVVQVLVVGGMVYVFYGYWKGWSPADFMYVTRAALRSQINSVSQGTVLNLTNIVVV